LGDRQPEPKRPDILAGFPPLTTRALQEAQGMGKKARSHPQHLPLGKVPDICLPTG